MDCRIRSPDPLFLRDAVLGILMQSVPSPELDCDYLAPDAVHNLCDLLGSLTDIPLVTLSLLDLLRPLLSGLSASIWLTIRLRSRW